MKILVKRDKFVVCLEMGGSYRYISVCMTALSDSHSVFAGAKQGRLCGFLVQLSLYGFGVAYVITSAISIRCVIGCS